MARPKIEEKHKTVQIAFQIRPEMIAALDACRQPWQSRSSQIREIVEAYLAKIKAN